MKGYIYLLENETGLRYLGSTVSVSVRLVEHNNDVTPSTRGKGPWRLIASWELGSLSEARRIESKIKRMKRKLTKENVAQFVEWFKKDN